MVTYSRVFQKRDSRSSCIYYFKVDLQLCFCDLKTWLWVTFSCVLKPKKCSYRLSTAAFYKKVAIGPLLNFLKTDLQSHFLKMRLQVTCSCVFAIQKCGYRQRLKKIKNKNKFLKLPTYTSFPTYTHMLSFLSFPFLSSFFRCFVPSSSFFLFLSSFFTSR